jgi:hypothetical protein
MKKRFVIHPIFFAIYPILALYAYNIDQVFLEEIWRSLFWSVGITIALFLVLRIITRDWERAGLICSLALALFFSYGHVYALIVGKSIGTFMFGRADYLAAIWASAFIILAWFILRKLTYTEKITELLNLISLFLLIIPTFRIIQFNFHNAQIETVTPSEEAPHTTKPDPDSLPDIYYIILDGYGRADVLDEYYEYDNTAFIHHLEETGFCIADNSHSNYAQTALSLASSLNYTYIQDIIDLGETKVSDRSHLANLVKNNRVRAFLSELGYQVVAVESGYSVTEWNDADIYLASSTRLNTFETLLASSSAAALMIDRLIPAWYRERISSILDGMSQIPMHESPKMVFIHLTIPHPPFVFGPNGEPLPGQGFREGNYYDGSIDEYIEGYRGQITYVNQRITTFINQIISDSDPKPIIILQSDHGPGAYLNWDTIEQTCLRERMSIFNAIYLPKVACNQLDRSITPVNTFPWIFNHYFNTEIDYQVDRSYYSLWSSPYDLIDITESLDTCNHPLVGD